LAANGPAAGEDGPYRGEAPGELIRPRFDGVPVASVGGVHVREREPQLRRVDDASEDRLADRLEVVLLRERAIELAWRTADVRRREVDADP
jgi:hypothetical protein